MKKIFYGLTLIFLAKGLSFGVVANPVNAYQAGTWNVKVASVSVSGSTVTVINSVGDKLDVEATQAGSWTATFVPSTFSVVEVGTASVTSASAILLFNATGVKEHFICNESTNPVRVGPSGITSAIGLILLDSSCISWNGPELFVGDMYVIGTDVATQKISFLIGK